MTLDITIAVLAGGKSTRMGRDKSFVFFQGRPMIEVVLDRVAGLGAETILIANNRAAYAYLRLPVYSDLYPDHGSLGGIFTAVHHARHAHTLVVACDMPWLQPELLRHLLTLRSEADVVVPRWDTFPEPLHAVYHKSCLPFIETRLRARQLKITGFYDEVTVRYVDKAEVMEFDENGRSFANVNTPDDLDSARQA